MSDTMTFAKNLRAARNAAKLSMSDLARRTGISQMTISRLEQGDVMKPSVDLVAVLADALGTSIDALVGRATASKPQPITELFQEDPGAFIVAYTSIMKARRESR